MILLSMYKKILTAFVLAALLAQSLAIPTVALAQAKWWAPTQADFNTNVNAAPPGEIFGERYTHAQVWWIIYSVINFTLGASTTDCAANGAAVGGTDPGSAATKWTTYTNCLKGTGEIPSEFTSQQRDWGIFALASMSDQMLYTKPISGIKYVEYVAQNIVGVPEANAQQPGFGFNTLQPLQSIWAASRNAAYGLMTLAVVILAFMIMFRMRISPQASVTVMSAIPRIIIGLLLITFSYEIAGFLVDLAYVVQGIIAFLVANSGLRMDNDVIDLFNMMNNVSWGIVSFGIVVVGITLVLAVVIGGLLSGPTGGLSVIASIVIVVLVLILFVIALVKVFWLLLKSYVMVIFHIIALPFAALGYVASPTGNMFLQVLRSLAGHVSVFVTISVVVMFAHIIFWNMAGGFLGVGLLNIIAGARLFNPYVSETGVLGDTIGLPSFWGVNTANIAMFVGLVVLLMANSVANNIKSLITTGRPDPRGGGGLIGAGLAGGIAGGISGGIMRGGQNLVGGYVGRVGSDWWSKTAGSYLERRTPAGRSIRAARKRIGADAYTGQGATDTKVSRSKGSLQEE
jgi:hypothetical protein